MKKIVFLFAIVLIFAPSISSAVPLGGNSVIDRPNVDAADGILFFDLNSPISQVWSDRFVENLYPFKPERNRSVKTENIQRYWQHLGICW